MYRFLLNPRWIAGILGILLAMAAMIWAGTWQLDRMHTKRAANAAITAAADAEPVPADELIPSDLSAAPEKSAEWRLVTVTGHYQPEDTVVIRQRTFDEGQGVEVVVPFVADDGVTYLIDRGYVLATARADVLPELPEPPTGEVTVTGRVRLASESTGTATRVEPIDGVGSVRVLNIPTVADNLGLPLAGGYIAATEELDAAGGAVDDITRIPLPPLDDGPHLSYAVQWFLFATITLVGLGYLIRREAQYYAYDDYDDDEYDLDDPSSDAAPDPSPVVASEAGYSR